MEKFIKFIIDEIVDDLFLVCIFALIGGFFLGEEFTLKNLGITLRDFVIVDVIIGSICFAGILYKRRANRKHD